MAGPIEIKKKKTARKSTGAKLPTVPLPLIPPPFVKIPLPLIPPPCTIPNSPQLTTKKNKNPKPRRDWRQNSKKSYDKNYEIPKSAMRRMVREIVNEINPDLKITYGAHDVIHFVAEKFLIKQFLLALKAAYHACRLTIMPKDMKFVKDLIDTNARDFVLECDSGKS